MLLIYRENYQTVDLKFYYKLTTIILLYKFTHISSTYFSHLYLIIGLNQLVVDTSNANKQMSNCWWE